MEQQVEQFILLFSYHGYRRYGHYLTKTERNKKTIMTWNQKELSIQ